MAPAWPAQFLWVAGDKLDTNIGLYLLHSSFIIYKFLWVAGDKCYNHERELEGLRDPHIAIHGSFSLMVNFHACRLYIENNGGFTLTTPHLDGFKCTL